MNKWIFTLDIKTTRPEYEAELPTNQMRQSMKFLLVFIKCHMFFWYEPTNSVGRTVCWRL